MDLYIKSILEGTHFSCNIEDDISSFNLLHTNSCNIDILMDHEECKECFLTQDAKCPDLAFGPGLCGLCNQFPSSGSIEAATTCVFNNILQPASMLNETEDHDMQQADTSMENSELSYSSDQYFCPGLTHQSGTFESVVSKCLEPPNKIQRMASCNSFNEMAEILIPQKPVKAWIGCPIRNVSSLESSFNSSQYPKHSDLIRSADSKKLWSGFSWVVGKDLIELQRSELVEPQSSVAARERRKKIGDKLKSLEKLIPGGVSKCDTTRMLEEAIKYMKFLQAQVHVLEFPCPHSAPLHVGTAAGSRIAGIENGTVNTNNFQPKTKGFPFPGTNSVMMRKLSKEQMLSILVTSPIIQRYLYTAERCVCIGDEKMVVSSAGTHI